MAAVRIAVIGGTGLVGRHAVDALARDGHEPVVAARSRGVDLSTGEGLGEALAGADAAIDATNAHADDAGEARRAFGAMTERLLEAEARAGVRHHVLLSILGVDRVEGNAHYAGKRRQEELVERGPVPYTILRAAQFHEFAEMVVDWTIRDGVARIPPLLVQPVAAADAARALAEAAAGPPQGRAPDLAGPRPEDLVDMARRALAARGRDVVLAPTWRGGLFGVEMAGEVLLAGPGARLASTTFDQWLEAPAASA
jgi:uncharacterized protein YbjT (DUF2867 family)